MGIKLISKILPASPDKVLVKAKNAEAALARMAHVNALINQMNDIGYYEIDLSSTNIVDVTTSKGIIDILNIVTTNAGSGPQLSFAKPAIITIANPDIPTPGADQTYIQLTPYYNPGILDTAVPYVLATGFVTQGVTVDIHNASPEIVGADQWEGSLYFYYEIKII